MFDRSKFVYALLLCLSASAAACSHVKPYEREYMTRPGMENESEEFGQEFEAHVQNAREGAPGRGSVVGGGCGCN
jgi:hypothetical protein